MTEIALATRRTLGRWADRMDMPVMFLLAGIAALAVTAPGQAVDSLIFTAEALVSVSIFLILSIAVAAYAKADVEGEICLQALVAESDGSTILRAEGRGEDPHALAQSVVTKLLDQGAQTILDNARHD